jgi:hypothetical protein
VSEQGRQIKLYIKRKKERKKEEEMETRPHFI